MSQKKARILNRQCRPIETFTKINPETGKPYTTAEIFRGESRKHDRQKLTQHEAKINASANS